MVETGSSSPDAARRERDTAPPSGSIRQTAQLDAVSDDYVAHAVAGVGSSLVMSTRMPGRTTRVATSAIMIMIAVSRP